MTYQEFVAGHQLSRKAFIHLLTKHNIWVHSDGWVCDAELPPLRTLFLEGNPAAIEAMPLVVKYLLTEQS